MFRLGREHQTIVILGTGNRELGVRIGCSFRLVFLQTYPCSFASLRPLIKETVERTWLSGVLLRLHNLVVLRSQSNCEVSDQILIRALLSLTHGAQPQWRELPLPLCPRVFREEVVFIYILLECTKLPAFQSFRSVIKRKSPTRTHARALKRGGGEKGGGDEVKRSCTNTCYFYQLRGTQYLNENREYYTGVRSPY